MKFLSGSLILTAFCTAFSPVLCSAQTLQAADTTPGIYEFVTAREFDS